jgi:hypothetical protein
MNSKRPTNEKPSIKPSVNVRSMKMRDDEPRTDRDGRERVCEG